MITAWVLVFRVSGLGFRVRLEDEGLGLRVKGFGDLGGSGLSGFYGGGGGE